MKQDCETDDGADLGRVSTDTKGGSWVRLDSEGSMSLMTGLTDD